MDIADLDRMPKLSPFELKDTLVKLASSHSERLMLNAGRASPNFLATVPRHGFFQLGLFAMSEAERSFADMPEGIADLPRPEGIAARFEMFAQENGGTPGVEFLLAAVSYAHEQLRFSDEEFLRELTWLQLPVAGTNAHTHRRNRRTLSAQGNGRRVAVERED
jgi:aspartate 4-decarboxylase